MRLAAVSRDQAVQLVEIQDREAGVGDRTQIAAAALHRHDALRLAGQRIGHVELRAGVAAAEIGDAQVGAEQVRTIAQQIERVATRASPLPLVPQILQKLRRIEGAVAVPSLDTGHLHVILKTCVVRVPDVGSDAARTVRPGTIAR